MVFAGDAAVGKTSFINRITKVNSKNKYNNKYEVNLYLLQGVFMSNLSSTLGVDFQVKTIRVDDR